MDDKKPNDKNYYQIGEFARLAHVSVSKLRYYDEIGLLKPNIRNNDSNYRFYDSSQLDRVATIKAFQRHGMSLQQMNTILHEKNSFFQQMAVFSNNKVEELNRQIDTLIQMRDEYENLALTYPVLARELEMDCILYTPVPSYKIIETNHRELIFMDESNQLDSHIYMQNLCKELNSVQWFASDTGYRVNLSELTPPLNGELMFRLSNRHPKITSDAMKTIHSADYLRYMAAMNEDDIIANLKRMQDYCLEIERTPDSFAYIWLMVDDYGDGTGKPIMQLCIPLL